MDNTKIRLKAAFCLALMLLLWCAEAAGADCGHQYETYSSPVNSRYELAEFRFHWHFFRERTFIICVYCGEVKSDTVSEEEFEEQERHVFEDGACVQCKYENPCAHQMSMYEEMIEQPTGEQGWEALDELTHGGVGNRIRWLACSTCGEELEREVLEEGVGIVGRHSFTRGICFDCRYINRCEHEEQLYEKWMENTSYEPLDGEKHQVTATISEYARCGICLEELGRTEQPGETLDSEEEHVFGEQYCVYCGYENPCLHEGGARSSLHIFNGMYESRDKAEHFIRGAVYETFECTLCNQVVGNVLFEEQGALTGEHVFEEGACRDCGFVNACLHELTQERVYIDSMSDGVQEHYGEAERSFERADAYEPMDWLRHIQRGDRRKETFCIDCGEILDDVLLEANTEEIAEHRLNGKGQCVLCGYANECSHEETKETVFFTGASYARLDADSHMAFGMKFLRRSCVLCRETLESTLLAAYAEEAVEHLYEEGACLHCGEREAR